MRILENFILDTPYLFLKKIPYAWIAVVAFWNWPPVVSGILLAIVLAGLGMMAWQEQAWEATIRRGFSSEKTEIFVDHPHAARIFQVRNLALVLVASAGLGWLMNGRITLSGVQWALLLAGTMLLYKDGLLFGAGTTYMITDQGIGIRFVPGHVDYRLFFKFSEIRQAARTKLPERIPVNWEILTPQRRPKEVLVLYAANPGGFTKQMLGPVLLAPSDFEKFQEALGGNVRVTQQVERF